MMRLLARSCNPSSPFSARRVSPFASQSSTDSLVRVIPYAGPKAVFRPDRHPTLRSMRRLWNSNSNIGANDASIPSHFLTNQKRQRVENWIVYGIGAAVVMISYFYVDSERQEHDRVNQQLQQQYQQLQQQHQQLQQRFQQLQNFSGFKLFVLESVKDIVAKRLSEWSGESEEAIMKSAVEQTEQKITMVKPEQAASALEAERKRTKV